MLLIKAQRFPFVLKDPRVSEVNVEIVKKWGTRKILFTDLATNFLGEKLIASCKDVNDSKNI